MSAQGNFEDRKTVPQRLKPSFVALFTARLKPCPSVIEVLKQTLKAPRTIWTEVARLKSRTDTKDVFRPEESWAFGPPKLMKTASTSSFVRS